jgi:hypothetical protein
MRPKLVASHTCETTMRLAGDDTCLVVQKEGVKSGGSGTILGSNFL